MSKFSAKKLSARAHYKKLLDNKVNDPIIEIRLIDDNGWMALDDGEINPSKLVQNGRSLVLSKL